MNPFQSAEIDQLTLALMQAHKEFGVVISKDRKGHKGTYASLPCVLDSIHGMCAKYGLVLTQSSRIINNQHALETILSHPQSKQWISSQSLLTPNLDLPSSDQAWGGSSTYHRRYDAMMIMGIFAEDDPADHDGETKASASSAKKQAAISDKQYALLKAKLAGDEALRDKLMRGLKLKDLSELAWKDFNKVLRYIEQEKAKESVPPLI